MKRAVIEAPDADEDVVDGEFTEDDDSTGIKFLWV